VGNGRTKMVKQLDDVTLFRCFNVEIDKHGRNLWFIRKRKQSQAKKRVRSKTEQTARLAQLRKFYEENTHKEISPFD
jgi:hypothetical protein